MTRQHSERGAGHLRDVVRRAFAEFLALPSCMIAAFLLVAPGTFWLDRARLVWLEASRAALGWFLSDAQSTAALLSTIAGSLITVTSTRSRCC